MWRKWPRASQRLLRRVDRRARLVLRLDHGHNASLRQASPLAERRWPRCPGGSPPSVQGAADDSPPAQDEGFVGKLAAIRSGVGSPDEPVWPSGRALALKLRDADAAELEPQVRTGGAPAAPSCTGTSTTSRPQSSGCCR
jgi:hypothetical protein